jgi:hypothetical protein
MRLAPCFVVLAVGCTGHWGELSLDNSKPLGVGLTGRYQISQVYCDPAPDPDCGNQLAPSTVDAVVTSGPARIGTVDPSTATLFLIGTGPGTAIVELTGNDGITTAVSIDVVPASTTLVVDREVDNIITLPDIASPAHVLTRSRVHIAQRSVAADGSAVAGEAVLALDHGTTEAALADDTFVVTGDIAGAARVTAAPPTDASLDLDIVGLDAIADLSFADLGAAIEMSLAQGGFDMVVIPTDAAGEPIVGTGTDAPQVSIGDASVAGLLAAVSPIARTFALSPLHAGSTTLDVTWGNVHKTFPVTVTP